MFGLDLLAIAGSILFAGSRVAESAEDVARQIKAGVDELSALRKTADQAVAARVQGFSCTA
jgi:hypothetical protein